MSRSAKGLLIITTTFNGFSLANHRRFAKLSPCQIFPLYGMLFGLLAVVAFESRNIPTVDWIRVIILNRIICTLYEVYMHYTYVSKSFVEQYLKVLVFMHVTRLAFTIFAYKAI